VTVTVMKPPAALDAEVAELACAGADDEMAAAGPLVYTC
jgi:hypothetical protein